MIKNLPIYGKSNPQMNFTGLSKWSLVKERLAIGSLNSIPDTTIHYTVKLLRSCLPLSILFNNMFHSQSCQELDEHRHRHFGGWCRWFSTHKPLEKCMRSHTEEGNITFGTNKWSGGFWREVLMTLWASGKNGELVVKIEAFEHSIEGGGHIIINIE